MVYGIWYMGFENKDPTKTMVSDIPLYWALAPKCEILMYMRSFGPLKEPSIVHETITLSGIWDHDHRNYIPRPHTGPGLGSRLQKVGV